MQACYDGADRQGDESSKSKKAKMMRVKASEDASSKPGKADELQTKNGREGMVVTGGGGGLVSFQDGKMGSTCL